MAEDKIARLRNAEEERRRDIEYVDWPAGLREDLKKFGFESSSEDVAAVVKLALLAERGQTSQPRIFRFLSILIGLAAACWTLINGFQPVAVLIKAISNKQIVSEFFVSSAMAQTASTNSGSQITLGPLLAYAVFALLAIGYIASIHGAYFGKTATDRVRASELAKLLTSFFIGTASGKLI